MRMVEYKDLSLSRMTVILITVVTLLSNYPTSIYIAHNIVKLVNQRKESNSDCGTWAK